jgi:hypothetical protein
VKLKPAERSKSKNLKLADGKSTVVAFRIRLFLKGLKQGMLKDLKRERYDVIFVWQFGTNMTCVPSKDGRDSKKSVD